jgi:hypothetical protein
MRRNPLGIGPIVISNILFECPITLTGRADTVLVECAPTGGTGLGLGVGDSSGEMDA